VVAPRQIPPILIVFSFFSHPLWILCPSTRSLSGPGRALDIVWTSKTFIHQKLIPDWWQASIMTIRPWMLDRISTYLELLYILYTAIGLLPRRSSSSLCFRSNTNLKGHVFKQTAVVVLGITVFFNRNKKKQIQCALWWVWEIDLSHDYQKRYNVL
jgi:hypothetical protein